MISYSKLGILIVRFVALYMLFYGVVGLMYAFAVLLFLKPASAPGQWNSAYVLGGLGSLCGGVIVYWFNERIGNFLGRGLDQ